MSDNLLINKYPNIANEWDYDKNINIDINKITYGSRLKVWWKCEKGHEWFCEVLKRTYNNRPCGQCVFINQQILNSLNDNYPDIMKLWNYKKNIDIDPKIISMNSRLSVWWICEKKHEWKLQISLMIDRKQCPYCDCKNNKNSLINFPEILKEWNYDKNLNLCPEQFTIGSNIKIWWKCEMNHEWFLSINGRSNTNGCPDCKNRNINVEQSLIYNFKNIANEWHPTKNNNLMPNDVSYASHKKVWWLCDKGHDWEGIINKRTLRNKTCPVCKTIIIDEKTKQLQLIIDTKNEENHKKSFGINYPDLVKNWNYLKNEFTPFDIRSKSHKKIWMKCSKNHEWEIMIFELINNKNCNCKKCYLENNNLQLLYPKIAQ